MKKILGLAIVSMAIFACNDAESPSINEDTRDTSTVIETPPPATTETVYVPAEGDYTYREKKVLVMKNGEWVEVEKEVKLDNGTIIEKDGTEERGAPNIKTQRKINRTGLGFMKLIYNKKAEPI